MSGRTSGKAKVERTARLAIVAFGLFVPALSLIPLGSIWLWQHGYLIYWAGFTLVAVTAAYFGQRWLFQDKSQPAVDSGETADADGVGARLGWSPLEEQAWADVNSLARRVDPDRLGSQESLLLLGRETIATVARRLHPGRSDPLWQFTPPEALAIIERVASQLRLFMIERVPFGDRIPVAQALSFYRWRGAVDYVEKAYDVWRLIRLANPISAATQEAREQLSKALVQWGRDEVARRLAETYVRETGRAAIDLYGGRLRVSSAALAEYVSPATAADSSAISGTRAEPLRILVAGQTGAGKSSLVNALAREAKAAVDALPATASFTPYALEREGFPAALLIDSPGIGADPRQFEATVTKAADCDLVLWVIAAHRADRDADRQALGIFRQHFAARLNRRRPPIILVATHIDRVRPFDAWAPPYDLAAGNDPKARNIRAAIEAAAQDLGFSADEAVPVSMPAEAAPYNVEAVWERIADALPEAMRSQLLRCLNELKARGSGASVWSQASKAGRAIAGSFKKKNRTDRELSS
jgi:predicted GTPase